MLWQEDGRKGSRQYRTPRWHRLCPFRDTRDSRFMTPMISHHSEYRDQWMSCGYISSAHPREENCSNWYIEFPSKVVRNGSHYIYLFVTTRLNILARRKTARFCLFAHQRIIILSMLGSVMSLKFTAHLTWLWLINGGYKVRRLFFY